MEFANAVGLWCAACWWGRGGLSPLGAAVLSHDVATAVPTQYFKCPAPDKQTRPSGGESYQYECYQAERRTRRDISDFLRNWADAIYPEGHEDKPQDKGRE